MLYTTVDARDGLYTAECNKCCCEPINVRPGETNLMVLNYAPWVIPIGGRKHGMGCTPQINVAQMQACPVAAGDNLPPMANGSLTYDVESGVGFTDALNVVDPEGLPLEISILPFYGPFHGKLTLDEEFSTNFGYISETDFKGVDRFFFAASDGINKPVIFEALLRVGVTTPALSTPIIFVDPKRIVVDQQMYTLSFPIEVSPAAQTCEAYRLTVRQNAYDCNYNCFWHISCYDLAIKQC